MAKTPETSDYTSVKKRCLRAKKSPAKQSANHPHQQLNSLLKFSGNPRQNMPTGMPFVLLDYLELVDWTGRIIREDKRGAAANDLPPTLKRLAIEPKKWLDMAQHFERRFKHIVGTAAHLKLACKKLAYQRTPNIKACSLLLN